MMRLDKYLAERTGMTRSESRKAITKGRVMVAGKICRKADTQLDETAAGRNDVFIPSTAAEFGRFDWEKFDALTTEVPEGPSAAQ